MVSTEGVPLAEPGTAINPHLPGLDPGLPGVSGAQLQWHQPLGQEIHGHQTEDSGNRLVSSQVYVLLHLLLPFIKEYFRVYFPCQEARIGIGKARVPDRTNLNSFNLLWLMWAVCGGFFITNFILCNYLKVLVKPVFEKPVDSSEDVVTRGLIPYMHPGTGVWKKVMSKMPDPYPLLAETMIISTSWPQFFNLSKYNTIEKESRIDHSHFFIFINGRELMPR